MARTTTEQVTSIIDLNEDTDDLSPFIDSASSVIDRVEAADDTVSAVTLELIERWLTAHYYAIYRQQVASESAGPVSESKQHYVSYGFQTTMYGTQAMTLDPTGVLADINAQAKRNDRRRFTGSVSFLGTNGNKPLADR